MAAAAARLGAPVATLTTGDGFVRHAATGRALSYGELAREAALLPPPRDPALKPPADWRVLGRSQRRVDLPAKVRGEPVFGMDVTSPHMLHAAIRHAPVFGAEVALIGNEDAARAIPGVVDVAVIDGRAVAVVAESWWRAEQAVALLDIGWTETGAETTTSAGMAAGLRAALDSPAPHVHFDDGDVATTTGRVVAADYAAPFATHACMEPMNVTAIVRDDGSAEA